MHIKASALLQTCIFILHLHTYINYYTIHIFMFEFILKPHKACDLSQDIF